MIDTFAFYVQEMMAALILFTALFIVIDGTIVSLFLLVHASSFVLGWSAVRLRNFGRLASHVYGVHRPVHNELAMVRRLVFGLTALFRSYVSACVGSGLQLRSSLIKMKAPLWARVVEKITTF